MEQWIQAVLFVVVTGNMLLLGTSRLGTYIRVITVQGLFLSLLPVVSAVEGITWRLALLSLVMFILKAGIVPWLLLRALKTSGVRREVEPFVGYGLSLGLGLVFLSVSFWAAAQLPLPFEGAAPRVLPVAFFTALCGLFLVVSRKKAITQLMGYIVLENGIYVSQALVGGRWPWMIEMAVMLDVVIAVLIMGRLITHLSGEIDHIESHRMARLKDWTGGRQGLRKTLN